MLPGRSPWRPLDALGVVLIQRVHSSRMTSASALSFSSREQVPARSMSSRSAVAVGAADEEVSSTAAVEMVVSFSAEQDVVAAFAVERVFARSAVEDAGSGDVGGDIDEVRAAERVDDEVAAGSRRFCR